MSKAALSNMVATCQVVTEQLKCGLSELRCVLSVQAILGFKVLIWRKTHLINIFEITLRYKTKYMIKINFACFFCVCVANKILNYIHLYF